MRIFRSFCTANVFFVPKCVFSKHLHWNLCFFVQNVHFRSICIESCVFLFKMCIFEAFASEVVFFCSKMCIFEAVASQIVFFCSKSFIIIVKCTLCITFAFKGHVFIMVCTIWDVIGKSPLGGGPWEEASGSMSLEGHPWEEGHRGKSFILVGACLDLLHYQGRVLLTVVWSLYFVWTCALHREQKSKQRLQRKSRCCPVVSGQVVSGQVARSRVGWRSWLHSTAMMVMMMMMVTKLSQLRNLAKLPF